MSLSLAINRFMEEFHQNSEFGRVFAVFLNERTQFPPANVPNRRSRQSFVSRLFLPLRSLTRGRSGSLVGVPSELTGAMKGRRSRAHSSFRPAPVRGDSMKDQASLSGSLWALWGPGRGSGKRDRGGESHWVVVTRGG